MKDKILFVPGIFNPKCFQFRWKKECERLGYEFLEFNDTFYTYWSFEKMKRLIGEGKEIVKKNENLIIVCHSFGGILINVILQGVKKYKVKKLVIIDSPVGMNWLGMSKRKKMLGYEDGLKYNCEVVSFGSYFDEVVPFWLTKYGKERHCDLSAGHYLPLFSIGMIREILDFSGIKMVGKK